MLQLKPQTNCISVFYYLSVYVNYPHIHLVDLFRRVLYGVITRVQLQLCRQCVYCMSLRQTIRYIVSACYNQVQPWQQYPSRLWHQLSGSQNNIKPQDGKNDKD